MACPYCQKVCKSEGGLKQHISKTQACNEAQRKHHIAERSIRRQTDQEAPKLANGQAVNQGSRRSRRLNSLEENLPEPDEEDTDPEAFPPADEGAFDLDSDPEGYDSDTNDMNGDDISSEQDGFSEVDGTDDEMDNNGTPNTEMLATFKAFCDTHSHHFLPFSKAETTSIKLLHTLKRKKAPLNAYQELLEWHLKETKHLGPHETLKDTAKYVQRKTLLKRLLKRYNMEAMVPKLKKLRLPHSKAVVTIPYRSAQDCIVSLLTDPRVEDHHYLFFDRDPRVPPPEKVVYIQDANTGDAFLQSYRKYITKPNQVPLGIKFYIDGATTGQFSDLPVTALKMALCIHSREARDNEWGWRELAWIPTVRKQFARGKKLYQESNHVDAFDVELMDGEGEYADSDDEGPETWNEDTDGEAVKAQDFHSMLSFALKSFVELQETGFIWDQVAYGKKFAGLEFVLFVLDVKCDTEEGDLLCGKYTVRTRNVQHICRYCHCPTADADNPKANYKMKKQKDIEKLVRRGDLAALKRISQQNIKNAWYKVRFHAANEMGIHGACPSEMLHAILLGIFKYLRGIFFDDMGDSSKLAEDMNGLAQMYGKLLTHQSDRDLPYTNFAKGIQKGKLMAKQYRGVLLVMAALLRSTLGRKLLKAKKSFGKENGLRDWTLLVELLLEWEAFLCENRMKRSHVTKLAQKHRYIMYIIQNVAKRAKGMGLKIMKFHAITHLVQDILLYGVPSEFDTGSNESHHKATKTAAKMTQRKEETFDHQTAVRMTEFMAVDLAMVEVNGGKVVWDYFLDAQDADAEHTDGGSVMTETDGEEPFQEDYDMDSVSSAGRPRPIDPASGAEDSESSAESIQIRTGGTRIKIFEDPNMNNEPSFDILGRSQNKAKTNWSRQVVRFLNDLQNLVIDYIPQPFLPVFTEHKRGDHIFRGTPNHRGDGPWKDWALIDWGPGYGVLPSHIWCFVDLIGLPSGRNAIEYGGIKLDDGVHAVVEIATYLEEDDAKYDDLQSELFVPLLLEVEGVNAEGKVTGRKFYLSPVDAITGPCIVIPDIGGRVEGTSNAMFQVKPRREWAKEFVTWLKQPNREDVIMESEAEDDDT